MNKYLIRALLLFLFFPLTLRAEGEGRKIPNKPVVGDTLIQHIYQSAQHYSQIVEEYNAQLYIKERLEIHKNNRLIRYVPSMYRFEKGIKNYVNESVSEVHYTSPNIFDRRIIAVSNTLPRDKGQLTDIFDYITLNIYSTTMMTNKLLSPLDRKNGSFYTYLLDAIEGPSDSLRYKILIIPKFRSTQLVEGFMWVKDHDYTIENIYFEGMQDVIRFKIGVEMGKDGGTKYLPVKYDLNIRFKFVGNDIEMNGLAVMNYDTVKLYQEGDQKRKRLNKHHHDLTGSYNLSADTVQQVHDKDFFAFVRPTPLTVGEALIYDQWYLRHNTLDSVFVKKETKSKVFWGQLGDALISSYYLNLSNIGSVKCSPLLNPVSLDYSHSRGLSYRQKFKYNRIFTNSDRLLKITPQIGFNFKDRMLYAKLDASFQYWPQKQGEFEVHVGNGNRIYSSVVIDRIHQVTDTISDLEKAKLDYFKDVYLNLFNSIEVVNGLNIKAGVSIHWRSLVNDSHKELEHKVPTKEWAQIRDITSSYNSFAPRIQVQFTPGLYYYMNGKRKINLQSKFPTFMVDYERGIKGVWGSNGAHERWEFDVQQNIALGNIRSIGYRVSAGLFTKQEDMYFIDFENFRKHNIPENWNDEIGGTFQLLNSHWYNASRKYLRGHVTYESPFILLKPFNRILEKIQQERLYVGVLNMPGLRPYIELGYGVGTHIFDAAIFVSSMNGNYDKVGFKITFELFQD